MTNTLTSPSTFAPSTSPFFDAAGQVVVHEGAFGRDSNPSQDIGFHDIVAAVRQRVSYLQCTAIDSASLNSGSLDCATLDSDHDEAGKGEQGWLRVGDLMNHPERLESLIRSTGRARGADNPQVAASLYVQSLVFRVASVATASWALGLPSPCLDPNHLAFRVTQDRPGELGVLCTDVTRHDAHTLAVALFDGLVSPLVQCVRERIRVGQRMLFGDAASSIASVFRAVQSTGPRGDLVVRDRAVTLFSAHSRFQYGAWTTIDADSVFGWCWDRSNCCLWFRSAEGDGRYCDDCSMHDRPTTRRPSCPKN